MTTLIINQKTGETFSLTSPLFDPEMTELDNLQIQEDLFSDINTPEIIRANVFEWDEEYELQLSAPGLDENSIIIDVDDNTILTVRAEGNDMEESDNCRRLEFVTRGFQRSFQLPEDADGEEIVVDYINGIIRLLIPKQEIDSSQIIEIIED